MESRPKFITANVTLTNADTWYPLPVFSVGEGCDVVIKSKSGNTAPIKVAHDDAGSKAAPFLLDNPGDSVSLRIKGTSQIVLASAAAGQIAEVIAEQ